MKEPDNIDLNEFEQEPLDKLSPMEEHRQLADLIENYGMTTEQAKAHIAKKH